MARKADKRAANPQSGVDGNGGSEQGTGGGSAPGGDGQPGGGSGDGSGGDGDSVIRPTLNGNGDGNGDGDSAAGNGEPRRGRGRPRGSGTGQKKSEISVTTLAEVISFAHVGIAAIVKNDVWSLDDGEAKRLADAASKVLRHYDTPAFSAQAMDWVGLIMAAGSIYGPRVAAARSMKPAPQPARPTARQEPQPPTAEQGDGYVTVTDPLGSGRQIRVQVGN